MGSVQAAREGKLQVLVGGSRDDFEKAKPVLNALGESTHYIGEIGKAATLKLALNLLVGTMIQGFAEFFVISRKAGVPFETMMEVLHAGPLESSIFRYAEQAVVNPGARPSHYLKHMLKDLNLAGDLARQLEVPVPEATSVRQILVAAKNQGHADDDFTAIFDMMAAWSGVPLRG
jgi:3-hydroxyisobutyrate dehydrogenase-like beta-hydroxyacid dehydrogenase